jgi:dihydroceramidase
MLCDAMRTITDSTRHLMTGTGAYFYIVWGIWLRHCLNYRHDEYELFWPSWTTMPEVVKATRSANGTAKKMT